jgi:hypothetical protein
MIPAPRGMSRTCRLQRLLAYFVLLTGYQRDKTCGDNYDSISACRDHQTRAALVEISRAQEAIGLFIQDIISVHVFIEEIVLLKKKKHP